MQIKTNIIPVDLVEYDDCELQIALREDLSYGMVGSLYPSILRDEINILKKKLKFWEVLRT